MGGYNLGDSSVSTSLKFGLNPAAKKKKPLLGALKPGVGGASKLGAFAFAADDDEPEAGAYTRPLFGST